MRNDKITNSEEFPDVRAFQDEFTRGFLQSTEETRSGYYSFLSGTGSYQMDFPADGVVGEKGYTNRDDDYEELIIGIGEDGSEVQSIIHIDYYSYKNKGFEENSLKSLAKNIGKELNFEKITSENQTLFISSYQYEEKTYGKAAYLQNNKKSGGLHVTYFSRCHVSEKQCQNLKDNEIKKINDWIMTVKFIDEH